MLEELRVKPYCLCVINSYVAEGGSQLIYARIVSVTPAASPGILRSSVLASFIASILLAAAWAQSPPVPQTPVSEPHPTLPLPGAFAPAPFALPGSQQAAQKQLCSLIRRIEPVQTADLVVTGDGADRSCKLLLTCHPGRRMTAVTLQSIAHLCSGSLPGLTPERLSILDTDGQVLYRDGSVQAAALPPPVGRSPLPWILVACLLGLIGGSMALQGRRASRARPDDFWGGLTRHQEADVLSLLLAERPETVGLLLANLPPPLADRLRKKLRRHRMVITAPLVPADAQVVETLKLSLQQQLRIG
ncbi:MAG: hypothetical protein ACYC63_11940 [Armatimonadota bacterium]